MYDCDMRGKSDIFSGLSWSGVRRNCLHKQIRWGLNDTKTGFFSKVETVADFEVHDE